MPEEELFSIMCELRVSVGASTSAELLRLLTISIKTGKFRVFRCELGKPIGYMAWAEINEESLFRLKFFGKFPKYYYEWNEGDIRLIFDLVIVGGIKRLGVGSAIDLYRESAKNVYIRKNIFDTTRIKTRLDSFT
jgi:hemolysin-activating ACP:hemolysin acyltransferase